MAHLIKRHLLHIEISIKKEKTLIHQDKGDKKKKRYAKPIYEGF